MKLNSLICAALFSTASLVSVVPVAGSQIDRIPLPEDYFSELRTILELSGERAPDLVQLGLNRQIADENLRIAEAAYYPSLSVNGNLGLRYVQRGGDEEDSEDISGAVTAGVNRPLFYWGAVMAGIDRGRVDFQNQILDTKEGFQEVLLDLRNNYLDLVINEMRLRNARLQRTIVEQEINQQQSARDAGRLSDERWRLLQIELNQSILDIEELTATNAQIIRNFRREAGVTSELAVPPMVDALDLDDLERLLFELQMSAGWVEQTLPMLRNQNQITREGKERIIIESRQKPNIDFSASVSQAPVNTANRNDVNTTTLFAGLSVQWNIFDGFETQARRRISFLNSRKLEFARAQSERILQEDEQRLRQNIVIQIRRQRLAEERLELDEIIYERAKREHEDGLSSANELREAQLAFYRKQVEVHDGRARILRELSRFLAKVNSDRGLDFLVFDEGRS